MVVTFFPTTVRSAQLSRPCRTNKMRTTPCTALFSIRHGKNDFVRHANTPFKFRASFFCGPILLLRVVSFCKNATRATRPAVSDNARLSGPEILVLIASGKNRPADGRTNFLGTFDSLVIAKGSKLPFGQLAKELDQRPELKALMKLWIAYREGNPLAIKQAMTEATAHIQVMPMLKGQKFPPDALAQWLCLPEGGDLYPAAPKKLKEKAGLLPPLKKSEALLQGARRDAQEFLPKVISDRMEKVRFVVWWDWQRKKFQPALWCPTMDAALCVLTALHDLKVCPTCDIPFQPERPDQVYHSLRCRERFRQQRRREKLRKEKP
jgi:hypothetical protein